MLAVSLKWRLGVVRRRTKGIQDWGPVCPWVCQWATGGVRGGHGGLSACSLDLDLFWSFILEGIPMVLGPSLRICVSFFSVCPAVSYRLLTISLFVCLGLTLSPHLSLFPFSFVWMSASSSHWAQPLFPLVFLYLCPACPRAPLSCSLSVPFEHYGLMWGLRNQPFLPPYSGQGIVHVKMNCKGHEGCPRRAGQGTAGLGRMHPCAGKVLQDHRGGKSELWIL